MKQQEVEQRDENKRKRGDEQEDSTEEPTAKKVASIASSSAQDTLNPNMMEDDVGETTQYNEDNISTILLTDNTSVITTNLVNLNPVQYESWSKVQVCSLLCTPKENGGAGLTIEDVQPLYDAGFGGTSLDNIIRDLRGKNMNAVDEAQKSFPSLTRDTIKTIVNWVDDLLKTRLYHLWSADQLRENLCKPIYKGGAGFSVDKAPLLGLDGYDLANITRVDQSFDEETMKIIQDWIAKLSVRVVELDFNVKTPTKNLSNLLEGMTKLDVAPEKYKFVNQGMQYVQRKEALNTYLNYTTQKLNGKDPKAGGASILFIGASPGVGKSRFALELPNYLKEYYSNTTKFKDIKMVNLAIWFSNGASLDPIEVDSNKKPLNLQKSIVARMIYSYIVHINPHSWYGNYVSPTIEKTIDLSLLLKIYNSLGGDVSISEFFEWLANKEQEEGKTLWLHFTLDEYNQLLPSVKETTPEENSMFDDFLNMLSTIYYRLPCMFTNLLSGTHMHELSNLKSDTSGGKTYLKRIELLNFDENEQEEIYLKQNYPLNIAKKTLFYSLGGHARLIELFGNKKNDSTQEIMEYLDRHTGTEIGAIRIGLELDKSTLEILIALCISQKPIRIDMEINGKTLKQLQRSMILFFRDYGVCGEKTVYIPLIVLLKLIKKLVQLHELKLQEVKLQEDHFLKELDQNIQSLILYSTNFEQFEKFNQIFLKAKLNCLWLLKKEKIIRNIQLCDIFPCVKEDCEIATPPHYTTSEILRYQFPLTITKTPPRSNVIFKNGKGASFADLFTILESTDDKYIFCYIQVRHTEMVTSMSETPGSAKILEKQEEIDESILVNNAKETLQQIWKEKNLVIFNLFITNRPVADDVTWPTVASNSYLAEYYGPFSIVVSYLGCVKMKITDIDEEDFSWIIGSRYSTAIRSIKTNWTSSTQEEKVSLLRNNLDLYQLKQLLLFSCNDEDKQAIMDAINMETKLGQ